MFKVDRAFPLFPDNYAKTSPINEYPNCKKLSMDHIILIIKGVKRKKTRFVVSWGEKKNSKENTQKQCECNYQYHLGKARETLMLNSI